MMCVRATERERGASAEREMNNWDVLVQFIAQTALTKCTWMLLRC